MKNIISILTMLLFAGILAGCSKDEPTPKDNFPAVIDIFGDIIWDGDGDGTFITGEGQTMSIALEGPNDYDGAERGVALQITPEQLSVLSGLKYRYYRFKTQYSFDRETGILYKEPHHEPYIQIMNYDLEKQEITVRAHFGDFIPSEDPAFLKEIWDTGESPWDYLDPGSYNIVTLRPHPNPDAVTFADINP